MNTLDMLIIVDTSGALAHGKLQNNVYIADSNKYLGSWKEETDQLHTVCQDGQILNWRVAAISPSNQISITGFSGQMVSEKVCAPSKEGMGGEESWEGRVETRGGIGSYLYTVEVSIDGRSMSFSPHIKVV